MSWLERQSGPNSPEYYPDAADSLEAQLRADAAHWFYLREIAASAETPQQGAAFRAQAGKLAAKWSRHESVVRSNQWIRLRDAFLKWSMTPDQAAQELRELERAHAAGEQGVDEFGLRNLRQAGELTGRWEPGITGSEQDSARWQPLPRAPSTTVDANADHEPGPAPANVADSTPSPRNVLDRALGTPQSLLDLEQVGAIIAGTGRYPEIAEDLESPDAPGPAAIPDQVPTTPAVEALAATQREALQVLQDLYAEHTRTVESTNDLAADSVEYNLAKVAALEQISAKYRSARVAAALAGAPTEVIRSVCLAGQTGTYWRDGPGDPRLNPATGSSDPGPMQLDRAPRRHDGLGAPDPPALAANLSNGGVAIGQAVDAASADAERPDWQQAPEGLDVNRSSPSHDATRDIDP
ncbi:hypothetical protein [Nocardia brasiliensis]|uniref:hypothetical protein n=1 Tax=Nocardia brasiliensis TaxID=37326 RepID=UPI00366CE763